MRRPHHDHLRHGSHQRSFAAAVVVKNKGLERNVAMTWNGKLQRPDPGLQHPCAGAVTAIRAFFRAFILFGSQLGRGLCLQDAVKTVLQQRLERTVAVV